MLEPGIPREPSPRAGWRKWLSRLGPWLVTAGILAALLHRYPVREIHAHLAEGDALAMVPFAVAAVLLSLLFVSGADTLVFRASLGRARWWQVLKGKAATSVLGSLGYGFGQSGYGLWLARATGAGVRATVGMISYVMLSDLAALCLVAGIAIAAGGGFLGTETKLAFAGVAAGLGGVLILAALIGPRLLRSRRGRAALLRPWASVGGKVYAASLAARGANLAVALLTTYGAARAFGLPIPLGPMLTYLPLVFLAGALPGSVAGFGAVQAAWVFFLEPWAPGAQILAFHFVYHLFVMFLLVARGVPFLRPVLREIEIGETLAVRSSATGGDAPAAPAAAAPGSSPT